MRRHLLPALLILVVVVTAATFSGVLSADFVAWDDDLEVYNNPHLSGLGMRSLHWMFLETGYVVRYQPLSWFTWNLIYGFFGLRPWAFHAGSLLFHSLNAALVLVLIRQLLGKTFSLGDDARGKELATCCAAAGALLWALHPLRVEAVAWVSAFLHCQALFFLLLAAIAYLASAEKAPPARQRCLYALSVISFLASLLSYPIGIGFVFVPILLDLFILRRLSLSPSSWFKPEARRIILGKLPFFAAAMLVLGITLILRYHAAANWPKPPPLQQFGLFARAMQACFMWTCYLGRTLLPVDLAPVYTTLLDFNPSGLPFLASAALVLLLTALCLTPAGRRHPALVAAWLCHLTLMVPVLGLTERPHFPSDRYSLLCAVVFSCVAAGGLLVWCQRAAKPAVPLLCSASLAAACASLTASQTQVWHNSVTLFTHTIRTLGDHPYRFDIYARLGLALMQRGELEPAAQALSTAVTGDPGHLPAQQNLAETYFQLNQWDRAEAQYRLLAKLRPTDSDVFNSLGIVQATLGNLAAATASFTDAVRLDPRSITAHSNLGRALQQQGKTNAAQSEFAAADALKRAPVEPASLPAAKPKPGEPH